MNFPQRENLKSLELDRSIKRNDLETRNEIYLIWRIGLLKQSRSTYQLKKYGESEIIKGKGISSILNSQSCTSSEMLDVLSITMRDHL
jgi:hypothetical protein